MVLKKRDKIHFKIIKQKMLDGSDSHPDII